MKNKITTVAAILAAMFLVTEMVAAQVPPANISGMKFNDVNRNGIKDAGEPGLANWTITLLAEGDEFPTTTLTGSDGNYTFTGLAPGNYTVGEILQAGWEQTAPAGGIYNIALSGVDITDKDFGNSNIMELSGVLTIVWSSIGPGLPPDFPEKTRYFLADDSGKLFELDLDENLTKAEGGPLRLDRKRVHVTGILDPETNLFKVLTINLEVIIESPTINSHLWAPHRSGSQRWATLLCRFGDATGVTPQPRTFFENLMTFMDGYWGELSYNNINLGGSGVFGWYNLPQNRAAYFDASGNANLGLLATDCTAAADADVNFQNFDGINLMFNQDLDCCSWGGGMPLTRDGVSRTWSATWMATWGWGNQDVLGQEMGHGFGLPHSSGPYAATYDSQWDVMSSGGTCSSPDPRFGCIGVHTVALYKDALGWIPGARRYVATTDPNQVIFIERLAQPGSSGFLEAKIPIGGSTTNFYTIESRKFVGFDSQVPGEAVVIHRVDTTRGDRVAQVVDVDAIPNTNPNDAGARWLPGELFKDAANSISVAVINTTTSGFWVVINPTVVGISGMKFNDSNGNGIKDPGDLGLAGWTITLLLPDGTTRSTVTDASGNYIFDGLTPATYTVGEILQPGWKQTAPAPVPPGTHTVSLSAGGNATDKDFGNFKLGEIHGVKFNDINGNGIKNPGDTGLAGWTIKLTRPNGTTVTTLTDASGNYKFDGLEAGTYTVGEILQPEWIQTAPAAGTYSVTITTSGTVITDRDFGNFKLGKISGMKFKDIIVNGVKDPGDTGLSGWIIKLTRPNGTTITTLTDASGNYTFDGLTAGNYTVSEVLKPGWIQTAPPGGTYTVTITSGAVITDRDFGNFKGIFGMKWNDSDGDRKIDTGEKGLPGWTIRLDGKDTLTGTLVHRTTVTNANGNYSFTDITPGAYIVCEGSKPNWKPTSSACVFVILGQNDSKMVNFGNRLTPAIK